MGFKAYHAVVAAEVLAIVGLLVSRHGAIVGANRNLDSLLRSAGFLFCSTGIVMGARALRERYAAKNYDTSAARQDRAYMLDRRALRVATLSAASALGSLYASSEGVNPWIAAAAIVLGLAVLTPAIDRLRGWR